MGSACTKKTDVVSFQQDIATEAPHSQHEQQEPTSPKILSHRTPTPEHPNKPTSPTRPTTHSLIHFLDPLAPPPIVTRPPLDCSMCHCAVAAQRESPIYSIGDSFGSDQQATSSNTYPGSNTHEILSPRPVHHSSSLRKGVDNEGNKTLNLYTVIGTLGHGASAKVKLARHIQTKETYAIKIMNRTLLAKRRAGIENARREIAIMKRLDHPNVVRLCEVIDDPNCNKLYLIMDHEERGPVFEVGQQGPLPPWEVRRYAADICCGLRYLHHNHIVHRDVKPANILVGRDGTAKLSDFGVSADLEEVENSGLQGSPAYMAPEVLRGDAIPGFLVDVWALGVTLYVMAYGTMPFAGETILQLRESTSSTEPSYLPRCGDADLEDLLRRILDRDLSRRADLAAVMSHPFLSGACTPEELLSPVSHHLGDMDDVVLTGSHVVLPTSVSDAVCVFDG